MGQTTELMCDMVHIVPSSPSSPSTQKNPEVDLLSVHLCSFLSERMHEALQLCKMLVMPFTVSQVCIELTCLFRDLPLLRVLTCILLLAGSSDVFFSSLSIFPR